MENTSDISEEDRNLQLNLPSVDQDRVEEETLSQLSQQQARLHNRRAQNNAIAPEDEVPSGAAGSITGHTINGLQQRHRPLVNFGTKERIFRVIIILWWPLISIGFSVASILAHIRPSPTRVISTFDFINNNYMVLSLRGMGLWSRYRRSGVESHLKNALICLRLAENRCPPGHPDRPMCLCNLGTAYLSLFGLHSDPNDLDEAIWYFESSTREQMSWDSDISFPLCHLASSLVSRFKMKGNVDDLEKAIGYHRTALRIRSPGHRERYKSLNNLANALWTQFERSDDPGNLSEAIIYHREAIKILRSPRHPDRPTSLSNLGIALMARFRRTSSMEDLGEAIGHFRESLRLRPKGSPEHYASLNNLGGALCARFNLTVDNNDLDEAVLCVREVIHIQHSDRSACVENLGVALSTRFRQQGHLSDLDEAIFCFRDALSLQHQGQPSRQRGCLNLAEALLSRFFTLMDEGDLEEAISLSRDALLPDEQHPNRATTLSILANALIHRFEISGDIQDIEDSVYNHREALRLRPEGHTERWSIHHGLANSLWERYKARGVSADLAEAISLFQAALTSATGGHPVHSLSVCVLADALITNFVKNGVRSDLDEATRYLDSVTDSVPPEHPTAFHILVSRAHLKLATISEDNARLEEVFALFKRATLHSSSVTIYRRLEISARWRSLAMKYSHPSLIDAYRAAIHLTDLDTLLRSSIVTSRQRLSGDLPSLASDAAAHAIEAGEVCVAVELLEQGRTILWNQMGRYRTPLDDLREKHSSLAEQLEELGFRLEASQISLPQQDRSPRLLDEEAHKYRLLSEEWDRLVERIQSLSGFNGFLKAPKFDDLKRAAVGGPVIIINISQVRSDAIIVRVDGEPIVVSLAEATPEEVRRLSSEFSRALLIHQDTTRIKAIATILELLWDEILQPIVEKLDSIGVARKSRVWWCPTFKLLSLPLHAAGVHKGDQPNIPNLYISSYTPTLSALLRATDVSSSNKDPTIPNIHPLSSDLLIVARPVAPGQKDIPNVREEIDRIKSIVPFFRLLQTEDASRDLVLESLKKYSWVHFASHGSQRTSEPFQAHFHLDEHLTLLDIIKARLPAAQFAFLSACHSAAGAPTTPDEVIHLAAGLQFSGFRSVIGTLWKMADKDGPVVAQEVYKHMFRQVGGSTQPMVDYRDAAEGLSIATKALRDKGVPLDQWTCFIHIGA